MYHFQLFGRKWPVRIAATPGCLLAEVTDEVDTWVFCDMLWQMFQGCPAIVISQAVDGSLLRVEGPSQFLERIAGEHGVEVLVTSGYAERELPNLSARTFVISVRGRPSLRLFEDVVRFGGAGLVNVVYGVGAASRDWREKLLRWNTLVLDRFNLVPGSDASSLASLLDSAQPICITIDGHLFFCLADEEQWQRLQDILQATARSKNLRLEIRRDPAS